MRSGADPYELLGLAESAAREAGEPLGAKRPQDLGVSTKATPNDVVAGAVYVPALRETYTAVAGGGAQRNGDSIRCSQQADLSQSLVATGFGYAIDRRVAQAQALVHVIGAIRDIRRAGAASVDLCS